MPTKHLWQTYQIQTPINTNSMLCIISVGNTGKCFTGDSEARDQPSPSSFNTSCQCPSQDSVRKSIMDDVASNTRRNRSRGGMEGPVRKLGFVNQRGTTVQNKAIYTLVLVQWFSICARSTSVQICSYSYFQYFILEYSYWK